MKGTRNRPENRLNLLEKSVNLAGFAFLVNTIIYVDHFLNLQLAQKNARKYHERVIKEIKIKDYAPS